MSFKSIVKSIYRGNYNFGRTVSDQLTRDMTSGNAKLVGGAIDVGGAAAFTYFGVLPAVGWAIAAAGAVSAAIAVPAVLPAALAVVAKATFIGALGSLAVPLVAGFTSAVMEKLNIPKPARAVAEVKQAAAQTAQAVAKPFKWAGLRLSHSFKKAHDGTKKAPKIVLKAPVQQPRPQL